ncbi:hypothetical protein [Corallincola holothuriorum]|nr:hypothetical protein [Corallincola holothuriorum]
MPKELAEFKNGVRKYVVHALAVKDMLYDDISFTVIFNSEMTFVLKRW